MDKEVVVHELKFLISKEKSQGIRVFFFYFFIGE